MPMPIRPRVTRSCTPSWRPPTVSCSWAQTLPTAWSTGRKPVSRYRSAATTRPDCAATGSALSEGGTVTMPFEKAPWGATFGMCVDRFGTSWMVNAAPSPPEPWARQFAGPLGGRCLLPPAHGTESDQWAPNAGARAGVLETVVGRADEPDAEGDVTIHPARGSPRKDGFRNRREDQRRLLHRQGLSAADHSCFVQRGSALWCGTGLPQGTTGERQPGRTRTVPDDRCSSRASACRALAQTSVRRVGKSTAVDR